MEKLAWPRGAAGRHYGTLLTTGLESSRRQEAAEAPCRFFSADALLGLEAGIEKQAMDQIDDDEQVADDDPKLPPGELMIKFVDLERQKRTRHDDDQYSAQCLRR